MPSQPNLLFIFTDEQAANTMGAYGNGLIQTPNMDRLAAQSVLFENAYVTQPVCTPSRASLLTGLYPHTNGCVENNAPLAPETPCFPELADFAGYTCAYYGKWHLGDEIYPQHGFTDWRSIDDGYRKYYAPHRDRGEHSTYHHYLIDQGYEPDQTAADGFRAFSRGHCAHLPEEHSKPAYLGREASRFIQAHRDHPFILFVNFFEPHMPYYGPRDDQHDPADIPLPPNYDHELDSSFPLKYRLYQRAYRQQGHSGLPLRTDDDWRRVIANYWGLVSLVDTHLGVILDTLTRCGLEEDTIVVYTSDHGDMMGSHRLLAKCAVFEEAVKVPLLLKIPGTTTAGRRIAQPVSQIDLAPTLLEAMAQPVPASLEGYSWLPLLRGAGQLVEPNVLIEWNQYNNGFGDILGGTHILSCWRDLADEASILRAMGDPVRTIVTPGGWKYTWSTIGEDQLHNLVDDPHELRNLAHEAEYGPLVGELRDRITDWQERTRDTAPRSR